MGSRAKMYQFYIHIKCCDAGAPLPLFFLVAWVCAELYFNRVISSCFALEEISLIQQFYMPTFSSHFEYDTYRCSIRKR